MYIHIYIYNALAELIHHELVRQTSIVPKGFRGTLLCCATLCVDLFSLVSLVLVRLQGDTAESRYRASTFANLCEAKET